MATPDVRVRLSAEGTQDVVAAFRKVQAEADQASKKAGKGFLNLAGGVNSLSNALGGLVAGLSVRAFAGWINSSIQAADAMDELSQSVGASVTNLSSLALVSQKGGVDIQGLGGALQKMNRFLFNVSQGGTAANKTLKDLGLSLDSFKGQDAVEKFETISKAMVGIEESTRRGGLAMQVFGRTGAAMIPVMQDLADEGLSAVVARAQELGVALDDQLVASAASAADALDLLKAQSAGIGARLAAGLTPALSQALQELSGDIGETADSWQEFGVQIGQVMKFIVAVVASAFDIVGSLLGILAISIDQSVRAIGLALKGNFKEALAVMKEGDKSIIAAFNDVKNRTTSRFQIALSVPPPVDPKPRRPSGGLDDGPEDDPAADADKRAKIQADALEREAALAKTVRAQQLAADKRAFDEGTTSAAEFYANRLRLAKEDADAQVSLLEKQRALAEGISDPEESQRETARLAAEIAKTRLDYEGQVVEILAEEVAATKKLEADRLAVEAKIQAARGETHAAAMQAIEDEVDAAGKVLTRAGASPEDRAATLDRLRAALLARNVFEETAAVAESALADLDSARSEIDSRVQAGLSSQVAGNQELLELEGARIDQLRALAQALEVAAKATGDPAKIAQAAAFAESVNSIGVRVQAATDTLAVFGSTLEDASTNALTNFFDEGITGAKSLKDAVRDMALSIIQSLKSLAAQLLATAIVKSIAGLAGGGRVGDGAPKRARGGRTRGRGSSIGDANLAWFSPDEFLVRAAVVRQPGVLSHLEALNQGGAGAMYRTPAIVGSRVPRFSEGGLIGGAGGAQEFTGQFTLGLEDGLVLREMATAAGTRVSLESVRKNRRAFRQALGV